MRLGIDLDNTIIDYDHAFLTAARERGLVAPDFSGAKQQLRDHIRMLPDGEITWQKLQGYVYGKGIKDAALFPGVTEFFARAAGHEFFIVSHKTEFGHYDPEKINLREAATAFLAAHGLGHVPASFHDTRAGKVEKIATLALDWFIDDLVEVYEEPHFPAAVKKILFHTSSTPAPEGSWQVCTDWNAIMQKMLA